MKLYNVYGISDWPETLGEKFDIFLSKPFESKEMAISAAKAAYGEDLEVIGNSFNYLTTIPPLKGGFFYLHFFTKLPLIHLLKSPIIHT